MELFIRKYSSELFIGIMKYLLEIIIGINIGIIMELFIGVIYRIIYWNYLLESFIGIIYWNYLLEIFIKYLLME